MLLLNIQDGRTAIFYASEQGSVSIVQFLIDSGVDLKLKDKVLYDEIYSLSITQCYSITIIIVRVLYSASLRRMG